MLRAFDTLGAQEWQRIRYKGIASHQIGERSFPIHGPRWLDWCVAEA